ncbi:uncharacterized protein METZ01_LOCUS472044, partial [marine metagenome]
MQFVPSGRRPAAIQRTGNPVTAYMTYSKRFGHPVKSTDMWIRLNRYNRRFLLLVFALTLGMSVVPNLSAVNLFGDDAGIEVTEISA